MSSDSSPPDKVSEKAASDDGGSQEAASATIEKPEEVVTALGYKSKLDVNQRAMFGFTSAEEAQSHVLTGEGRLDAEDSSGHVRRKTKHKNQNVVYGVDPDDMDDDYDDDQDYAGDYDSDEDEDLDDAALHEHQGHGTWEDTWHKHKHIPGGNYNMDDLWEDVDFDEEEEMDPEEYQRQLEETRALARAEQELLRSLRLAEILKKKELLIEKYLKTARVMINHRKRNIYLQDYLYHLALRKGVLRGDPQINVIHPSDEETKNSKAIKHEQKRQQKHNTAMSSRFARFLQKTAHLDEQEKEKEQDRENRSNRHHHRSNRHKMLEKMIRHSVHGAPYCPFGTDRDCFGEETMSNKTDKFKKKVLLTMEEQHEKTTAGQQKHALKGASDVLDAFEKHRSKMAKKRQQIKIATLLHRAYSGTGLMPQERDHLVSFVEQSVKAQNLAKWKALRRQNKNKEHEAITNKTGVAHLNHQWTKSLERIRELRLKKAKLEHEHRLELLRKVRHWHFWDKKVLAVLQSVYTFVASMGTKASMTKGEAETFSQGLDLFHKQLYSLYQAMLTQVVKMFKAKGMLYMAQRKANDAESSKSAADDSSVGFSIADYERMKLETNDSQEKRAERQRHLLEQHEKLKKYMGEVANTHATKQRAWGALRAGRHDMKILWDLCVAERDNLLKKMREVRKHRKRHRRRFMQISLLENKRCLTNFAQIEYNVHRMQESQRDLHTQVGHTHSVLRVLKVRFNDIIQRLKEKHWEQLEKRRVEQVKTHKQKISSHISPQVPNTIYSLHVGGCDSSGGTSISNDAFLQGKNRSVTTSSMWLVKAFPKQRSTKLPSVIL